MNIDRKLFFGILFGLIVLGVGCPQKKLVNMSDKPIDRTKLKAE